MKKLATLFGILLICTMSLFANKSAAIFLSGNTIEHGDYVVVTTEDVYYYMGQEYEVYKVMYDNPAENMNIAINRNKYIAYTNDFIFFYECSRKGFGIRKALFNNPETRDLYDPKNFSKQTVLYSSNKIDKEIAIGLIVLFVPKLK
jgi:hypothetical protein